MKLVLRLIAIALPASEREYVLGDIEEEFAAMAHAKGDAAAARWLRGEALRVLVGAISMRRTFRPSSLTSPAVRRDDSRGPQALVQTLAQDAQYAMRLLRRSPAFAAICILTLAVGIGANATVFSVVHGVLMKPLPYADPDRLVRVYEEAPTAPRWPMGPANFLDYRAELRSFEHLAAYMRGDLQFAEGDRPEQLRGMQVTSGFFDLLGWSPAIGREFLPLEEADGNDDVVVLSHALWQRRFAADPGILSRTIRLSGRVFRVVGVLPPGFQHVGGSFRSHGHGETVDVWWVRSVPQGEKPQYRLQHYFNVVGRLRPGVTLAQANAELLAVATRLNERHPKTNSSWTALSVPLQEEVIGTAQPTLYALLAAAHVVLLLTCVNVAGLLLGRAAGREREMGVRAALGASRLRLARQLLVESLVLATAGGALGVALAYSAVAALARFGPADIPRLHMIAVDGTVLFYTLVATLLTALLFGFAPAVQLARSSLGGTLKQAGRGTSGGQHRLGRLLVATEVALAFVLVASAGLLLRSYVTLSRTDPGFRPNGVITAMVALPPARYSNQEAVAFHARLAARVRALPGVREAGVGSDLPWTGYNENTGFGIVGRTFAPFQGPEARYHFITPGYVRTLDTPVVAGRDVADFDSAEAPPVVLLNESAARRYWKSPDDALGARLNLWGKERTVAGVIGGVRDQPSDETAVPALYFPQAQMWYAQDMFLAARSDGDPHALVGTVRQILHDLDPALPLANVASLDEIAGAALATRRFALSLVGLFGLTALFLAVVGVYGVMAQAVGQRLHEFGVRQALGARPADILRHVLSSGTTMGLFGLIAGVGIAVAATRWLASLLYRVDPADPQTFAVVAVLLLFVTIAASYLPARRATRSRSGKRLRGD